MLYLKSSSAEKSDVSCLEKGTYTDLIRDLIHFKVLHTISKEERFSSSQAR